MTIDQIIALAAAKRKERGLELRFQTPDTDEPFICYPKDDEQKQKWLKSAAKKGWTLIQ